MTISARQVLAVPTGLAGHTGPLLPALAACVERGDRVRVVVPGSGAELLGGYDVLACPEPEGVAAITATLPSLTPDEAAQAMDGEVFPRLYTDAMLPAVERACAERRPTLILREPCAYAGLIAAQRLGVPHAQVAISMATVEHSASGLALPALAAYGVGADALRGAPLLTRFPAALDPSPYPDTRRYRETSPVRVAGPPLVYATLGTVAPTLPIAAAAFRALLVALGGLSVDVVLSTAGFDPGSLPANVTAHAWVDQSAVLAHATLVICHGGSGTVLGALAAGIPLVVLPMFADQSRNARAVVAAGAGLAVEAAAGARNRLDRDWDGDALRLRDSVLTVLADPTYTAAAAGIATDLTASPTVRELIDVLVSDPDGPA
jgi:UDP:flavonoid glycosyltransferase YjiC (YdhE family)